MENQTVWKSKTELKLELKSHKIKMALDHNCKIFFPINNNSSYYIIKSVFSKQFHVFL